MLTEYFCIHLIMDNLVIIVSFITFCMQLYLVEGLDPFVITSVEAEDLIEDIGQNRNVVVFVKSDSSPIHEIFPKLYNNLNAKEPSSHESDSDSSSDLSEFGDDDNDDNDGGDDTDPTMNFKLKRNILRWSGSCGKQAAKRCKKACRKALKDACYEYHCKKSMKRSIKKECKRECKSEFIATHMLKI